VRGPIAGGIIVAAVGVAALVAVGSAGANGHTALEGVIGTTQTQLGRLAAVQFASAQINIVRAVGGLAGAGIGVGIGSVATYYFGWRR
jgi:hypothetical protein